MEGEYLRLDAAERAIRAHWREFGNMRRFEVPFGAEEVVVRACDCIEYWHAGNRSVARCATHDRVYGVPAPEQAVVVRLARSTRCPECWRLDATREHVGACRKAGREEASVERAMERAYLGPDAPSVPEPRY